MALDINVPSYGSAILIVSAVLAYICLLSIKRLYFDPLSAFPGPKLAAITLWYEFYYDCIVGGQYSNKIVELHKQYNSTIIRINPFELHISDADFYDELYAAGGRKRDRDYWFAAQFGADESHFGTQNHDQHRERRSALAPLFSIGSVRKLQPVVEERVDKLIERFREFRGKREILDLTLAFPALTYDIISEFSFAQCEHAIERPDWGEAMTESMLCGTKQGHLMKHLPMLRKLIEIMPESLILKLMPAFGAFTNMKKRLAKQIALIQQQKEKSTWSSSHVTVFSEILDSKLPPHEKTPSRLADEGRILVQAGTLTTSWALSLALFYLLSQPQTLQKLREELATAIPDPNDPVLLVKLEQLPYLSACIKESLRMSLGTSSRLPRTPTEETLVLRDKKSGKVWNIPMGTKCSMTTEHIMSDPTIYKSPGSFLPERWIGDEKQSDKYFLPFSRGTRACTGMNLAYGEFYLTLGKLFRTFGGPGSVDCEGIFRLYETTERDVIMAGDFFIPFPYEGSKGVRVMVEEV